MGPQGEAEPEREYGASVDWLHVDHQSHGGREVLQKYRAPGLLSDSRGSPRVGFVLSPILGAPLHMERKHREAKVRVFQQQFQSRARAQVPSLPVVLARWHQVHSPGSQWTGKKCSLPKGCASAPPPPCSGFSRWQVGGGRGW
jgi:hypothetical protein